MELGGENRLYSASEDRTVKFWDLEKRDAIRTFEGATESIRSLAVGKNGKVFVASKGAVLVWGVN